MLKNEKNIYKWTNGYKIYLDIMTGENCRQYRLITGSLIGQFIYPVGGEGMEWMWGNRNFSHKLNKFHINKVHDNLV